MCPAVTVTYIVYCFAIVNGSGICWKMCLPITARMNEYHRSGRVYQKTLVCFMKWCGYITVMLVMKGTQTSCINLLIET